MPLDDEIHGDVPGAVRVLTITGPGSVEVRDEPDTDSIGAHEVSGSTVCTLVSPGTEIMSAFRPGAERPPRYPVRPGYSGVFRVEEVGDEVEGISVGDLVYAECGHRSRQRVSAEKARVLPEGLDPFDAVFARLMAVPLTTLATTSARPGARIGVSGLGLVGHLAAAIFVRCGYSVTAWDPNGARRALAPAGAEVLDHAPVLESATERGAPSGLELVLECSGHDGAVLDAVHSVRAHGEVVLVGTPWTRRTDTTAQQLLHEVFHRYAVVRSGWEWRLPRSHSPFSERGADENLDLAFRWLRDGSIQVSGLARRSRVDDAGDVYSELAAGTASTLTAIFDWTD
jgi:threonine dehydrogenase-like Zn-dependent dehydrogenase